MAVRPEFQALLDKFEADYKMDFTPKEEAQIKAADNPAAKAAQIAKSHHSGYQSRAGGRFGPGKVGASYYKQGPK